MSDSDIWKKMTTPMEIEYDFNDDFIAVKSRFDYWRGQGSCIRCPVSGTIHNMPYRRTISKGMANGLKELYKRHFGEFTKGTHPTQFADFTKLRYWGLIRQEGKEWKITQDGIDFVRGVFRVPKNAVVVNNVFKQYLGDPTSIHDILG